VTPAVAVPPPGSKIAQTASRACVRVSAVGRVAGSATPGPSAALEARRVTGLPELRVFLTLRRGSAAGTGSIAGSATFAAAAVAATAAAGTGTGAGGAGAATRVAPSGATTSYGRPGGVGTDKEAAATALASPSSISIPTTAVAAAASADSAGRGRTGPCRRRFLAAGGRPDGDPGEGTPRDGGLAAAEVAMAGAAVVPDVDLVSDRTAAATAEPVLAVPGAVASAPAVGGAAVVGNAGPPPPSILRQRRRPQQPRAQPPQCPLPRPDFPQNLPPLPSEKQ